MESYKEKLKAWNKTEKYNNEVKLLRSLIGTGEVLDVGCGTGQLAKQLMADGYDVQNLLEVDFDEWGGYYGLNKLLDEDYEEIYFMHSIAHIEKINTLLQELKNYYRRARITVITPNKEWLDPDYNNDTTVIRHYSQSELKELFVSCGYEVTLIGQFGEIRNGINERIFLQAR